MEPILVYFDFINRTALVVRPKKPFFDWLKKIDPEDDPLQDFMDDSDVYLLPNFEDHEEMENWLKKNYDQIFCDQMNHWYTDEDLWIQKRTFKLFNEWFDYSMHTMIWDTLDKPVSKT